MRSIGGWPNTTLRYRLSALPMMPFYCSSEYQARRLQAELERRFAECGLALHSDKTQIVYCKDHARRGQYPNQKFDFLGYTFRPRLAITDGVRPSLTSVQAPA